MRIFVYIEQAFDCATFPKMWELNPEFSKELKYLGAILYKKLLSGKHVEARMKRNLTNEANQMDLYLNM